MAKPATGFALRVARILTLGLVDRPRVKEAIREAAIRATRAAMSVRSLPLPRSRLSPILVIAPHPDDETLGCGGTMALLAEMGAEIHVAFVSDGGASHIGHPVLSPRQIADLRRAEALRATAALGVPPERLVFIDAPDGRLPALEPQLKRRVVSLLASVMTGISPKAVLLPCRSDGSSEHNAVFRLVTLALKESRIETRLLEYPVWAWRNPLLLVSAMLVSRNVWSVDISPVRSIKAKALHNYASQLKPLPPDERVVLGPDFASLFLSPTEFFIER